MPYRKVPLITNQIYHVFNRSIGKHPIFNSHRENQRFLDLISYYSYEKPDLRFSHYNRLAQKERNQYLLDQKRLKEKIIDIFGYCLMPNHFHILLKEKKEKGITNLIRNIQNSYAKYYNIKNKRSGGLFQAMFKAVLVEDDNQFVHVLRYIHLNPLTSYQLKDFKDLEKYPFNSFYILINNKDDDILDKRYLREYYRSLEDFKAFTYDQIDYQRQLDKVRHLMLE